MRDLSKTYHSPAGDVYALTPMSLSLVPGEFICIVGPSGCGKTTLLMMMSGLTSPSTGEVWISGQRVTGPYANLGIVFQSAVLLDWRTALANVMLQIEMRNQPVAQYRDHAVALLEAVGLGDALDRYPGELSGGMRQRVSIARALVHDPELLLMDEPFAAVDALTRDQLTLDLQSLWLARQKTVIFITHNIDEAVFLADRIIVMSPYPGRIAEIIDNRDELPRPRTLRDRAKEPFTRRVARIREVFLENGVLRDTPPAIFTDQQ